MSEREGYRGEALDWMILLRERPDDQDVHARFRQWRRTAGGDAAWRELGHVDALIRQAGTSGLAPPSPALRRWPMLVPFAMAACIAALFLGREVLPIAQADLTTGTGEVRSLRLADGSRVTLAPQSAVAIGDRRVRLLRGAAYFDVRHDGVHPFRVLAGDVLATDLGTAFEVRREDAGSHIAVREGRVRASCRDAGLRPADLGPGDMALVECAAGRYRRSAAPPSTVASWMDGRLVVTDRPLADVVGALRPWFAGMLVARGAGMRRHVTGVYDLRHPDHALAALRQAHGATVWQITPWLVIVTAD